MGSARPAVVIGAGIGGIAAAIRLAAKGYAVTVLEANPYVGGKLTAFTDGGYRFDAGPSLFTAPEKVDALFRLAGENPRDHFNYRRLDEVCRYGWPDGTRLTASADPKQFARAAQDVLGVPQAKTLALLAKAERIYGITSHVFLERSLHRWQTYARWPTLLSILRLPQIDGLRTLHRANAAAVADARLVQLFDRYATYNGSNPYRAPATLGVIPHLEFGQGAYFPDGGMHQIPMALAGLAQRMGVQFRTNSPAEQIVTEGRSVAGVRVAGEVLPASVVVSNADLVATYRNLLPQVQAPERLLAQEKSTSGLIFYWGIGAQFEALGLHNIFFSGDYRSEFDDLFRRQTVPTDPTVYLNISSKYQPTDAPPGCENWFVMVNTPHDSGQPWDTLIAHTRQRVLGKLSSALGRPIEPLIATEAVLEPRLIAQRTSSYGGALYGNASNTPLAAFLRHPNRSGRVRGLYFVGGSVHPGGGIPLCLQSAQIATDLVPGP